MSSLVKINCIIVITMLIFESLVVHMTSMRGMSSKIPVLPISSLKCLLLGANDHYDAAHCVVIPIYIM